MTGAEIVILVVEIIGTIVFAFSGILVAMEKRLDFFGIGLLACTTAVGGGIIRDLVLGNTPPVAFRSPIYLITAIFTAVVAMVLIRINIDFVRSGRYLSLMPLVTFLDAVGLGIFCVVGVRTCLQMGYGDNVYLVVFVGMITGVGGGMLRDIMVSRTPQILRREIYATAAIIGSLLYYYLRMLIPDMVAFFTSALAVIAIRLWSIKFHINLPKPAKK